MNYVDELKANGPWRYGLSCHMFPEITDIEKGDLSEFHKFAQSIGLKREWFQKGSWPHYDLNKTIRAKAVKAGAIEITSRDMARQVLTFKTNIKDSGKNIKEILDKVYQ